jgi:hypothetical protein
MHVKFISSFFAVLLTIQLCVARQIPDDINQYNIVWDKQSKNAGESMPLVGGDLGCNVWVENGEILFYVQRSGSLSESGEYLKLGRFRVRLNPNPFLTEAPFRQKLKPAEEWLKEENQELPQFYPLFPFDQFQIGDDEIQIFKNTYFAAPEFRKGKIQSWHQDGIFFARMGMTKEAADYNTRKLQDSERRSPTFWGPGHDWVPDHNWGGSGMIGLQEMVLQTIGEQIVLFPAWPKEWDVDFKLHAPGNTTVECCLKNGEIERLDITPQSRMKDVVIK